MNSILKSSVTSSTQAVSHADGVLSSLQSRVPVRNAEEILDRYNFSDILGQGGFGTVMKATRKSDGLDVAIKVLPLTSQSLGEAQLLAHLDHPNIVQLIEVFFNGELIFLVQEYCEARITDIIKSIDSASIAMVVGQLLLGLQYIHSLGIIHRDIKPDNILLKKTATGLTVKIADFGIAVAGCDGRAMQSAAGTNHFLAPEVINNVYDCKADMWSLGVLVLYLVNKQLPFRGTSQRQIFHEITTFDVNAVNFPGNTPESLKLLARALLDRNHTKRPSASEALECEVFQRS